MKAKITGWGKKYKGPRPTIPFTPKEYNNSYVKKSFGGNYNNYLKTFATKINIRRKVIPKRIVRRTPRKSSSNWMINYD